MPKNLKFPVGASEVSEVLAAEQTATAAFVAGKVLHELGNPAAAIKSNLSFVLDVLPGLAVQLSGPDRETFEEAVAAVRETEQANDALVARLEQLRAADTNFAAGPTTDIVVLAQRFAAPAGGPMFNCTLSNAEPGLMIMGTPAVWSVVFFRVAAILKGGDTLGVGVELELARVGSELELRFSSASWSTIAGTPLEGVAPFVLARKVRHARIDETALDDLLGRLQGRLQRSGSSGALLGLTITVPLK
ncbi:MAG: hypothetical protein SGI86_00220 [Deltaproteobacteria bacterium]|nr:hypothetical protein [Deltaproteobacteria bacterium]